MNEETLITDNAATTTEGAAVSQVATEALAADVAQPPEGDKPADAPEGAKTEDKKPDGAPEQYEDFTFADGKTLADADDVKALAKELNLPQDKAQKLAETIMQRREASESQQAEALAQARTEWADATRADKELGGEQFDANLAVAKKGLEAFGTPELKSLLNESGLGNHPEVIRFMYRAGKAISEDRIVTGAASGAPADPAKRLFPNQA